MHARGVRSQEDSEKILSRRARIFNMGLPARFSWMNNSHNLTEQLVERARDHQTQNQQRRNIEQQHRDPGAIAVTADDSFRRQAVEQPIEMSEQSDEDCHQNQDQET